MKVKCVSLEIPREVRHQVGWSDKVLPTYQLTLGKFYEVYGIAVPIKRRGSTLFWTIFFILNDQDRFRSAPEDLFEIVDCSTPINWCAKVSTDRITFGFSMLHNEEFLERLSDGEIAALAQLEREKKGDRQEWR
jgi:hypothetical protein